MTCAFCDGANVRRQEVVTIGAARVWTPLVPVTKAHLMVMPTRHVERHRQLSEVEAVDLHAAIGVAFGMLQRAVDATAMNLALNDGPDAGQSVPHLHMHVWGRVPSDPTTNPFPTLNDHRRVAPPPVDVEALTRRWREHGAADA